MYFTKKFFLKIEYKDAIEQQYCERFLKEQQ